MPQTDPPHPIPEATVVLVKDLFNDDSVYLFIGNVLFDHYHDDDLADLYPVDG